MHEAHMYIIMNEHQDLYDFGGFGFCKWFSLIRDLPNINLKTDLQQNLESAIPSAAHLKRKDRHIPLPNSKKLTRTRQRHPSFKQ
jgi:hypothetical protein